MATITKRIYRRSDGKSVTSWRVRVRLKEADGYQSKTFTKRTDAVEWATETERDVRRGEIGALRAAAEHTLADAIDAYLVSPRFAKLADQRNQGQRVEWWRTKYGKRPLAQVDAGLIATARDRFVSKGMAGATINRYLAALSAVLRVAVREKKWLPANPVHYVDKLNETNARDRVLSREEAETLLAECAKSRNPGLRLLVLLALSTAARRAELTGLEWRDVDLRTGRLVFRKTKGGKPRAVTVSGPAHVALKEHATVRRIDDARVFPGSHRESFVAAVKRAGLDNIVFHSLRHSALTWLAEAGATLSELKAISGHKTLAMVARYQHIAEQHTSDVLGRMVQRNLATA